MNGTMRKLLTIITEAALENVLIKELQQLGAHGYTITDARGKGIRGTRNAAWDESSNIRLEVLCDAGTSDVIAAHLLERYYANYAMVLFVTDVTALGPEKQGG
jgi:nitrogen regulatory protein PII